MLTEATEKPFDKGKTISIIIKGTPVTITFAARPNEKIATSIKSALLNSYLSKIK